MIHGECKECGRTSWLDETNKCANCMDRVDNTDLNNLLERAAKTHPEIYGGDESCDIIIPGSKIEFIKGKLLLNGNDITNYAAGCRVNISSQSDQNVHLDIFVQNSSFTDVLAKINFFPIAEKPENLRKLYQRLKEIFGDA